MRSPTPHRKVPARAAAVGMASAMLLAACGTGDVDPGSELGMVDGQLDDAASDSSLESTIPAVAPVTDGERAPAGGGQAPADDAAPQSPGLPVASDQAQAPTAAPAQGGGGDGAADGTPTSESTVTTSALPTETTAPPATQPPPTASPTTQAPTTSPPVAANLPNLAVVDLASGSSVGFPQAAQSNGLPLVLWFWSPT